MNTRDDILRASSRALLTAALAASGFLAKPVLASGFQADENSAAGIGTAHADKAAASDASTIAGNPAGLTYLNGDQAELTLVGAYAHSKFTNQGTTAVSGAPVTGNDGGNPGGFVPIAAQFGSHQINNKLYAGIGIYAPYGAPTTYKDGWVGRYWALNTDLKTLNINPTLAYKLSDDISLGAGFVANYTNVKFTNDLGMGNGCTPGMEAICSIIGNPSNALGEGFVKAKFHGWAYGFDAGVLAKLTDDARLGLSYHSHLKQDMDGSVNVKYPSVGLDNMTSAHTVIDLPDVISLSYFQNLSPSFSLMADVSRTRWSRFNEVRIKFDNPTLNDVVVPENWHDTTRISLGGEYRLSEQHTLRAGTAWDPSPVTDDNRTARIPDADRVWISVGYGYHLDKDSALDVGYAHLFVKDSQIHDSVSSQTGGTLNGTYTQTSGDILGVSFVKKF